MADAPGRPLSSRVQRYARAGRELPQARQDAGTGHRGHAAAAPALSARRGDPVFRHPHRSRRHGPRARLQRRRRAALRAAAARRGGDPQACGARPFGRARLCARCSARSTARARRAGAADRLFRQPVHARLLHGRRRGQRRLADAEDHAACAPGTAAPDPGSECTRGDRLSQRPDRSRRAGGDDLRYLGRDPFARGLREIFSLLLQKDL